MRVVYADPPYIGQAKKHYSHDPRCAEVDHAALITQLRTYDGWALSASSPSLYDILPLLAERPRIGIWIKPFASFKPNVNPAYAWEPIIWSPARPRGRDMPTLRDWVSANITLRKGLSGVKPEVVCHWMFEAMGSDPADDFTDLFPGSGAVGRAWQTYRCQPSLALPA